MADIEFITNPIDYSGATLTEVIEEGKLFCYDGDTALGADVRFLVIGDGVTALSELDRFVPQSADAAVTLPLTSGAITSVDSRIVGYCHSTTALRFTILFGVKPKQDATSVTFNKGFVFRQSDGTEIYTVTAGDTADVTMSKVSAVGIITTTGLTAYASGSAVGSSITVTLS